MNPAPEFEVGISGATRELLVQLHRQAALSGQSAEFLAALRVVLVRLRSDPVTYGEELFDLRAMKHTVKEAGVADQIDWVSNQPMAADTFARLRDLVRSYLQNRELYVFDGFAGADARHQLPLRVVTEKAWHSLFARCLFLRPTPEQL